MSRVSSARPSQTSENRHARAVCYSTSAGLAAKQHRNVDRGLLGSVPVLPRHGTRSFGTTHKSCFYPTGKECPPSLAAKSRPSSEHLCSPSGAGIYGLPWCSSIPQLPFNRPPIPSNRYHKALNGGTLGGLGGGVILGELIKGTTVGGTGLGSLKQRHLLRNVKHPLPTAPPKTMRVSKNGCLGPCCELTSHTSLPGFREVSRTSRCHDPTPTAVGNATSKVSLSIPI